jgi:nucleolar protein 56
MVTEIVSTWYGVVEIDGSRVVRSRPVPVGVGVLLERLRDRRAGRRTPEEEALLRERGNAPAVTRDRRLVGGGVTLGTTSAPRPAATLPQGDPAHLRPMILVAAEETLAAAWDPSIHVEEAVRAMADLDSVKNLLGERLVSWASRDLPSEDGSGEPAERWARMILDDTVVEAADRGPEEPELKESRRRVAELYVAVSRARTELETGVSEAMPRRAANLCALLGAPLAARLVSQAGGLGRLARLPASTVQVLGAEKAFFEHLRGRAPPPRHGLLFLHPTIQGAPRYQRGRLARALAGKVAIAARLDYAGAALRPDLKTAFEARTHEVRRSGAPRGARRRPRRSVAPLDGAAEDR